MIPGSTTKLSEGVLATAATIAPRSDLVKLTGTTSIATITPAFAGFSGLLLLVPTDGDVILLTTGNIEITSTVTMLENRLTVLAYSKADDTWYPGAIS